MSVCVPFTDAVKLLGVTLDSTLSFDKHIIDGTRVSLSHSRHIRRPLLTLDAAKAVAVSIVGLTTVTVYCMVYLIHSQLHKMHRVPDK